ncbi:MAG: hypothetical protein IRZ13_01795 [Acetobacteraceae bacterium]|nr:hypothetical protein [Acetobacteraceae bacterium]
MPDTRITALPVATTPAEADLLPIVQGAGFAAETRRTSLSGLRAGLLADRPVHVRDFGAVGNGIADDGPAIQAAIDALNAKNGGTLLFGPRRYRIASPVVIDGVSVVLQGAGFTEGPSADDGTCITIDTTGFTPFTFTGTGARGSAVRDIAVRQTHSAPQTETWAPTDYPFVFDVVDCYGAVDFENVFLCAVNRGIRCDNSGRLNIQRLRGQVFTTGVEIDRCYDIPRIHHVHFWNFWSGNLHIVRWQQANTDGLVLRRCDGVFLDDIFAFGCRSMIRFAASASGVTTKFYLGKGYADFAKYGLWVEGNNVTGQIACLTTQGELFQGSGAPLAGSSGLRLDGNNAQIQVGNLRIDACEANAVRVGGRGNRLDIFALRCERYNLLNDGSAALHLVNAATGTPNRVFLGTPPILGNGNGGPLVNAGTNGTVVQALTAPGGTANAVEVTGAVAGGAPGIAAAGADADISLSLAAKGAGAILAGAPIQIPAYAVGSLPAAAWYPRCLIYVTDGAGNRRLAVSDGTSWRWPDGSVVS